MVGITILLFILITLFRKESGFNHCYACAHILDDLEDSDDAGGMYEVFLKNNIVYGFGLSFLALHRGNTLDQTFTI